MDAAITFREAIGPIIFSAFQFVLLFIVLLFPYLLLRSFWKNWVAFVRATFFAAQKYKVLELKIPRGITKSPLAMELFMTSLYQTGGEGNWFDKYWNGSTRPWFSLEVTSIDGVVRFFIWTRDKFKDMIETQLYGQFPDIEITEVADYTNAIEFNAEKYDFWGCEFIKTGPSHLPIKTYVDYGLDKDPKEEVKIDPITTLIEFLGSLKPGEQAWIQICVRAHVKHKQKPGGKWGELVDWKHDAAEDLKKRMKRDVEVKADKPVNPNTMQLSKGEKDAVDAIEKSLAKTPFDCGIRSIYAARKDAYRSSMISGLTGAFRQYNSSNLNGFKPDKAPGVKYPWQDRSGKKVQKMKKELFDKYKARAFFVAEYIPVGYKSDPFVMNIEELATIYHFPGDVSRTPTLSRVQAKKSEPPANLPI
ncbi:MAG: hypothetical protein RL094_537 [Candidatus Parcubacteria bacterium]